MKLGAYLIFLVVGILVLPSVSAVDNSHIALYTVPVSNAQSQSAIWDACYEVGGALAGDGFKTNNHYFDVLSNIYNWSNTIPKTGNNYYKDMVSVYFVRGCKKINLSFDVDNEGYYDIYLPRTTLNYNKLSYTTYLNNSLLGSFSHTFNDTYNLMPLNNVSSPPYLNAGNNFINFTIQSDINVIRESSIGYSKLLLVKRGNASVSNYTISYPSSSVYHKDLIISIIGDTSSTMEISSISLSLNGQYSQTLTKSGIFNFNASKTVDMLNSLLGDINLTVNVTDSYGYENISNYSINIADAPDIITEAIYFNSSGITSGDTILNITVQHFNNGTIDANNFLCNTTFNPGGIPINDHTMSLSVDERKNMSYNYTIQAMSGWFTITHTMSNTTPERTSNNNLITSIFKIHASRSRFSVGRDLRDVILNISVLDEDGIEILTNSTSDLINDYFEFDSSIASNSANITVNYTTNNTYLSENSLTTADFMGTRWNESMSIFDNMTTDLDYILSTGYDDNSFWFVTTKYSTFSIIIKTPSEPEPTPTPAPTPSPSSSGSSGSSASLSRWWKHLNQYIIVVYDSVIDKPFAEKILDKNPQAVLKSYNELTNTDKKQNLICVGGSQANRCTWNVNLRLEHPFRYLGNMRYDFEGDDSSSMAILGFAKNPYAGEYTRKTVLVLAGKTRIGTDMAVDHYLENYLNFRETENSRLI